MSLEKSDTKIIISGSIAIDRIMNFNGSYKDLIKPDKLHVISLSILIDKLQNTRGGVGANIAYTLALLEEKPILLGSVGSDAKDYMTDLKKIGIDISNLHWSNLSTASYNVITDMEDNQIGGFYPGAMFDSENTSFKKFIKGKDKAFFVISPDDPKLMRRLSEECLEHKLRMFYDVGQQINNIDAEDIKVGVKAAEVIIVNDYELSVLLEKANITKEELLNSVDVLITTLGAKGCTIESIKYSAYTTIPAVKVNNVVDPTGAGDAFRAGFLYGYIRDWPLEKSAKLGTITSAYAVQEQGTQTHKFTRKVLENV